jgi:hypothetical protein
MWFNCSSKSKFPAKTILSEEMEKELCAYLKKCALMNHDLTTTNTKQLTYSFATTNNVAISANWHQNEKASHDGLNFFMKKNPTLSVRLILPFSYILNVR